MSENTLINRFERGVSPDFFRPLTRQSAAIYVECARRLEEESGLAGRLPLQDAQQIIREVLGANPTARLEEDEGSLLRDVRQRAGVFMNKLLAAGWLEEQTLGLQDRRIIVTPGLRLLLGMLRALVQDVCRCNGYDHIRGGRICRDADFAVTGQAASQRIQSFLCRYRGHGCCMVISPRPHETKVSLSLRRLGSLHW